MRNILFLTPKMMAVTSLTGFRNSGGSLVGYNFDEASDLTDLYNELRATISGNRSVEEALGDINPPQHHSFIYRRVKENHQNYEYLKDIVGKMKWPVVW